MSTTAPNPKASRLPAWAKPGAAAVQRRGGGVLADATIERCTATQVILINGARFRINRHGELTEPSGSDYYPDAQLFAADDPKIVARKLAQKRDEGRSAANNAGERAVNRWLGSRRPDELDAAIAALVKTRDDLAAIDAPAPA